MTNANSKHNLHPKSAEVAAEAPASLHQLQKNEKRIRTRLTKKLRSLESHGIGKLSPAQFQLVMMIYETTNPDASFQAFAALLGSVTLWETDMESDEGEAIAAGFRSADTYIEALNSLRKVAPAESLDAVWAP